MLSKAASDFAMPNTGSKTFLWCAKTPSVFPLLLLTSPASVRI